MSASINPKLTQLAQDFYISYGSTEQKKIDISVDAIKTKLKGHFGTNITQIIEFGSYKRDTILPRKFDEHSDIDLMVVFNHLSLNMQPGTYRNNLVKFAEKHYSRSEVYKSTPTVVLELDHIKYDLVPTHIFIPIWTVTKTYYIPENDSNWMATDPNGFNEALNAANNRHSYNIKRVIRLLKAWNAKAGYPLSSFELEKEIASMTYFFCKTLEDYFFFAIDSLSTWRSNTSSTQKIQSLKDNARRVKEYLHEDKIATATIWLNHILPI